MSQSFTRGFRAAATLGVATIALVPVLAFAQVGSVQDGSSEELADPNNGDIVVTGTLIRGAAPVGQSVISVGPEKAQAQGAATSNEILATVPQITNLFVTVPNSRLGVASNQIQVVRPDLRNLNDETGSSSSTLVLIDGHRLAGVGVTQSTVDPDVVPQSAIERVEVVTDGGSATYGADAVGGVINFVTRKRFDGVKVDARYGFADDYWTTDANIIAGKDWGTGSLYAAYSFQKNSSFFGRDREFVRALDWNTGIPSGRSCNPGNVTVGGVTYALPSGTTPGTFNSCDLSDDSTAFPAAERHSAMISLHQQLNDSIKIDLRGFWAKRRADSTGPLRGEATVTAANFYYQPVTPGSTANQTVAFTFAPVLGNVSAPSGSGYETWGANGEVTIDISDNWEFRGLLNYSRSKSYFANVGLNQALLGAAGMGATAATAVNFYNPAATSNLDLIRAIANYELAGQGRDEMFQARAIVAGSLFSLPGGDVRLAAGYEYLKDSFSQRVNPPNGVRGSINTQVWSPYARSAHSLFGELQVPIFGEENRMGGFHSLMLSGSVRYDNFSDFGSTVNPKFGVNYKPLEWFTLRGNWSTSFNAPSPVAQLGAQRNTVTFFPLNAFVRPGDVIAPGVVGAIALQGSTPNLQPQTATTWSIGGDVEFPGFRASVSYYNVDFQNLLSTPTPSSAIFANFPNNVIAEVNGLTVAQILTYRNLAPNAPLTIDQTIQGRCPTPNDLSSRCNVYELVDFRSGNFGTLKVRGLDFNVSYRHMTSFGGIDASVAGNYQIERTSKVGPGAAATNGLLFNTPKLTMQFTAGADIGNFRAQLTLNHVAGYAVQRTAALPQDSVDAFDIVNLFFRYNVPGESTLMKGLSLTLNINNVFNTDPPLLRNSSVGLGNGYPQAQFTLGRLVMLGVSKRF